MAIVDRTKLLARREVKNAISKVRRTLRSVLSGESFGERMRSGAGSMPASPRRLATVVRPISIFSPRSASRIFVYPQPGL